MKKKIRHALGTRHMRRLVFTILSVITLTEFAQGQDTLKTVPDGTNGETIAVLDSTTKNTKKPINVFNLGFTTLKIGLGVLFDYASFSQDAIGKQQMDSAKVKLLPGFDVRDSRFVLSGKFKTKRTLTWKMGIMWDGEAEKWYIRESGVMIAVPELWGSFFIGRTKEGISQVKVMNGYSPAEGLERYAAIDPIPILADGIKWLGYLPKPRIFWNAGIYNDVLSYKEGFSTYKWQAVLRAGCLPIYSKEKKEILHIAGYLRFGRPENDSITLKSRPESAIAPFFIDTKKFQSSQSTAFGGEVYYSKGAWLFGSEYIAYQFDSPSKSDPLFHGGEIYISYIFTGESRPYTTSGGNIYSFVPIGEHVFQGGPGAIEGALRFSNFDLDDGAIKGGKMWRISPIVSWYPHKYLRLYFSYGYTLLDRYKLNGVTHSFQTRLQIFLQ